MEPTDTTRNPVHLCIGAPRAGTPWLFHEFSLHPGLFVPQIQEVRYWNSRRSDAERARAIGTAAARLEEVHDRGAQETWLAGFSQIPQTRAPSVDEYLDLMCQPDRPAMDISPTLCFLDRDRIRDLRAGLPEGSKVLYLIREPMERLASQIRLHFHIQGRYRGLPSVEDLKDFLSTPLQRKRWDYATVIDTWGEVFGEDLHILRYEDIQRDPKQTLQDLAEILGVALSADIATRPEQSFFHEIGAQGRNAQHPALGIREQKVLARALEPDLKNAQPVLAQEAGTWLRDLRRLKRRKNDAAPARRREPDLRVHKLMRMTESLGDNSEYGAWQRDRGYEPASLFRWANLSADDLLGYFRSRRPLFQRETLRACGPTRVQDGASGITFESGLVDVAADGQLRLQPDPDLFETLYTAEKQRLDFLATRFWSQMRHKPALYIIKSTEGRSRLDSEKLDQLHRHLRAENAAHLLLWVEEGENWGITELKDGLLHANLSAFAPETAVSDYAPQGWSTLMADLVEREDITGMIRQMQR